MFIYFPEFFYKTFKKFVVNSFPRVETEKIESIINFELKSPDLHNLFKEFKENKLQLPQINIDFCSSLNIQTFLDGKSSYDYINNTIRICYNYIDDYSQVPVILRKELLTAYDYNIKYKGSQSLNTKACISIRACK